jgi:hypothetical protein
MIFISPALNTCPVSGRFADLTDVTVLHGTRIGIDIMIRLREMKNAYKVLVAKA